jgi:hypothetical protein
MQLAHREALGARGRADRLERFVGEQGLVAGYEVDLGESSGELALELTRRDFQVGPSSCVSGIA